MDVSAERWCSMKKIAADLGVRRDAVLSWIVGRGLHAAKIGRLWKCKRSETEVWRKRTGMKKGSRLGKTQ